MAVKTVKNTSSSSKNNPIRDSQVKALDNLQAIYRVVQGEDFKAAVLPYLRMFLIKEWPDPSKYDSRDKFYDAYCAIRAEVEVSKKIITMLSPVGIEAQIKVRQKQLAQQGKDYEL